MLLQDENRAIYTVYRDLRNAKYSAIAAKRFCDNVGPVVCASIVSDLASGKLVRRDWDYVVDSSRQSYERSLQRGCNALVEAVSRI
jgi:hypothetical protein